MAKASGVLTGLSERLRHHRNQRIGAGPYTLSVRGTLTDPNYAITRPQYRQLDGDAEGADPHGQQRLQGVWRELELCGDRVQ